MLRHGITTIIQPYLGKYRFMQFEYLGQNEMLWCNICCEPYHPFCLHQEDLPLDWDGNDKKLEDWICRRCCLCQVCGLPGDADSADKEDQINATGNEDSDSEGTNKGTLGLKRGHGKKKRCTPSKRQRLKCAGCCKVFHSDCLQPSQQKMIKAQGLKWVIMQLALYKNHIKKGLPNTRSLNTFYF